MRAYVDDPSAQTLSVGANIAAIRFAFSCLKGMVVEHRSRPAAGGAGGEDVAKLQLQLQQVTLARSFDVEILTVLLFLSQTPTPCAEEHGDCHPRQYAEQAR